MSLTSSIKTKLQDDSPTLYQWLRRAHGIGKRLRIRYLLSRIIRLCDFVLADMYRFPSPRVRKIARWLARQVGESCAWLRTFLRVRMAAFKLIGPDYTIVFIGSVSSKRQLCHLFFDEAIEEQQLGEIALWGLSRRIREWLRQDVDMVIHEHPRLLCSPRFRTPVMFTPPVWVEQTVSIPESVKDLSPGKRKLAYMKRCIEEGYAYEFSQSEHDLDHFYQEIYIPYINARYGERVLKTPYDQMKRLFRRGGLLLVTLNGQTVAGNIFYVRNGAFFKDDFGLLPDGSKAWKQGGSTLLDWFCILWAHGQGVRAFNMGGTRAWHSDGVFRYKSLWGAKAARRSRICDQWTFMARLLSQPLQDRINQIGFVSELNERLYGIHLTNESEALAEPEIQTKLSTIQKRGLAGLAIVSLSSQTVKTVVHEAAGPSKK